MRILIIGFLVFSAWSVMATYIYVCKIKELCDDPIEMKNPSVSNKDSLTENTLNKPVITDQVKFPKDQIKYFAFDKSEFKADPETDKYVEESKAYLAQHSKATLFITGHTDAIGSNSYNLSLGYRRAQSLQQYFESKGILKDLILIESMGKKEPADNNNTKTGRANNRRAVITLKNKS